MAKALPENKKRVHEVKVRFSDEEIALADEFQARTGKPRAELLRELYMMRVRFELSRLDRRIAA